MNKRGRGGLTVIEVMVSIVILATGILITMAAISFGAKATSTSAQSTEATAYSRRLLEIVLAGGPRGPVVGGGGYNLAYNQGFSPLYANDTGTVLPFRNADFVRPNRTVAPEVDAQDLARFAENAARYKVQVRVQRLSNLVTEFNYSLVNVTVELQWRDRLMDRSSSTTGLFHG